MDFLVSALSLVKDVQSNGRPRNTRNCCDNHIRNPVKTNPKPKATIHWIRSKDGLWGDVVGRASSRRHWDWDVCRRQSADEQLGIDGSRLRRASLRDRPGTGCSN